MSIWATCVLNIRKPYEDHFWVKNKINLVQKRVSRIDHHKKILEFEEGSTLGYDKLVIATGSKPNRFGWPGQDLKAVQGLYHKTRLRSI